MLHLFDYSSLPLTRMRFASRAIRPRLEVGLKKHTQPTWLLESSALRFSTYGRLPDWAEISTEQNLRWDGFLASPAEPRGEYSCR